MNEFSYLCHDNRELRIALTPVFTPTYNNQNTYKQMKKIQIGLLFLFFLFGFQLSAQEATENTTEPTDIFEMFRNSSANNGATVTIFQDERIEALFRRRSGLAFTKTLYRVQVFSSNAQRDAKTEAYNIEKTIREQFPDENIYVSYIAPFWKVRMGDFRTREEAQNFRTEVARAFPQFRNQIYVVPVQPDQTK